MIDFTTIQAFPIPLPIVELQQANIALHSENKLVRNLLIGVVLGAALILGYNIYIKNKKENERNTKKQL